MQALVEIAPSNASQGQHGRKDATEQMKNLTFARIRTQVLGFSSADALSTKLFPWNQQWTIMKKEKTLSNKHVEKNSPHEVKATE